MITLANSPVIWRPFTQMQTAPPPLKVTAAEGAWLTLDDGRRILDCISSWWVTVHGHSHPTIADAIHRQSMQLEHVIFAGFTHDPAEQLVERLAQVLPKSLNRFFYSDNGSTSVEVALKIARQYWFNHGATNKTRFIGFEGGYHGDTVGAMSIGAGSPFWNPFKPLLFPVDLVAFPSTHSGDEEVLQKERSALERLDQLLGDHEEYAAIVMEPLVQGAGGMRMCREEFVANVAQRARDANVLVIFDEVMTGFGRTGEWFASLRAQTAPDIICMSKGISGGFLPLAVTVSTSDVYEAFLSDQIDKTFFHGHSYTANPLACAAAIASFDLLQQWEAFRNFEHLHERFYREHLEGHPATSAFRVKGTIAALDVVAPGEHGYFNEVGPWLKQRFLNNGFLIRPLGNTVYLMPPYCMTAGELESAYGTIKATLDELTSS